MSKNLLNSVIIMEPLKGPFPDVFWWQDLDILFKQIFQKRNPFLSEKKVDVALFKNLEG